MSKRSEALRLFVTNRGPCSRLEVGGEVDVSTVGALRDNLDLLVDAGTGDVELDTALVSFCDAAFLNALVATQHRLAADGRRVRIAAASEAVSRLLQLAGLDGAQSSTAWPERQSHRGLDVDTRASVTPIRARAQGQEGTHDAVRQIDQRDHG